MAKLRFFLIKIFLFCLVADRVDAQVLTLTQLWERRIELYDDPRLFQKELESKLLTFHPKQNPELWAMLHAVAGEAAWFQEDTASIEFHVAQALAFSEQHKLLRPAALLNYLKGGVLENEGKPTEAEPWFGRSIALAKQLDDPSLLAYVMGVAGTFYQRNSQSAEAAIRFGEALPLFSKLPQDFIYFDFLASIGTFYAEAIGPKREEGIEMVEKSLVFAKEKKLRYLAYWAIQSLISIYKVQESSKKIDELLQEEITIAESLGYDNYVMRSRMERGRAAFRKNRCQDALLDFEAAQKFFKQKNMSYYDIVFLSELGRCYVQLKKFDRAKRLIEELSGSIQNASSNEQKHGAYSMLRSYYIGIGDKEKELKITSELVDMLEENAKQKKAVELGRIARDLEVKRQQYINDKLSDDNKQKTEEIDRRERIQNLMLGILGLGILALMVSLVALRRGQLIKQQRANLKLILDTIDEGILRINSNLSIQEEYSRYSSDILAKGENLQGKDLWALLFARSDGSREELEIWRESMRALFGEDSLAWELNEAHLPRQLKLQGKTLALDWQRLPDHEGITQMILLLIRDISGRIAIQNEAKIAQERVSKIADRIDTIARSRPQRIAQYLTETDQTLLPLLHKNRIEENQPSLKRTLHTLKGSARSLGLKDVSEILHGLEDLITSKTLDQEAWSCMVKDLEQVLAAYRDLLPHLNLVETEINARNLWDIASKILPEAQQRLQGERLDFPEFQLKDSFTAWDRIDTKVIQDMLLHAVTNSIDHGFLLAEASGINMQRPILALEAHWQKDRLELLVRDNGIGIDWDRIKGLAQKRGFEPSDGRPWTDVLFLDGISTAEKVSRTSGRGIGLSAVHDCAQKLGGEVSLLNNDAGPGALLKFDLPVPTAKHLLNRAV